MQPGRLGGRKVDVVVLLLATVSESQIESGGGREGGKEGRRERGKEGKRSRSAKTVTLEQLPTTTTPRPRKKKKSETEYRSS